MQFVFGPGNLVATPLTDAYGNAIAVPTPRKLGVFQEGSFDASAENKMLYGPNQAPVAVGRGKGKVGLKVKAAQISIDQWNAVIIGQPANQATFGAAGSVMASYIDTVGTVLGTTVTPVTSYAAYLNAGTTPVFDYDLGVVDGNGNIFDRVTGTPSTGQYALSGGVYTFAAADAGIRAFISFVYTATPTANTNVPGGTNRNTFVTVANLPMGQAPNVQLDFSMSYGANQMLVTFFSAIGNKISMSTKLDDFSLYDMEFDGFANSSNNIYRVAGSQ